MTKEEAISWLTNEKWKNANNKYKKEWNEAFNMAISALSADADHDGCDGCRYVQNTEYEYPCSDCRQKYKDMWTQKPNDFVEVVRCKDCIHRIDRRTDLGHFMCEKFYGQGDVSDENFCQWGERREECD